MLFLFHLIKFALHFLKSSLVVKFFCLDGSLLLRKFHVNLYMFLCKLPQLVSLSSVLIYYVFVCLTLCKVKFANLAFKAGVIIDYMNSEKLAQRLCLVLP